MTATLQFNLPEEHSEFMLALHGSEFYSALSDVREKLRTQLKHGDPKRTANDLAEDLRTTIYEALEGTPEIL